MRIFKIICVVFLTATLFASCANEKKKTPKTDVEIVLDQSTTKLKKALKHLKSYDSLPRNIPNGKKHWKLVGVKDWCSGFWPGVLWYGYEHSGNDSIKIAAEKFTEAVKPIAYSSAEDHDIGFQIYCSFGNGYRLTGNESYKEVMLAAADTLATLYNPIVGAIQSWPSKTEIYPHNTIIDNMMNLELLFWAAKNGENKDLYNIAESHANITMKYIVRPDSAVYHLGEFNDKTGEFIKGHTHQGYADESMWARGQTWGIYGFALAYRETGRDDFLNTSIKLADHFLNRLPEDGIPYWDFDDPKIPNAPKDASAAAVAACGMLELANVLKDEKLKTKYTNAAKKFVKILSTEKYLSGKTNDALLLHSTGHHPKGTEIDVPIIYADYYFMEALTRLEKLESSQ
ncbi:unsaturated chondroitin disaccharide hydrolase [Mariniflexile fucanivorans]|uniref:Unsaturated chondroitin disaccharide hydrolase n=1 Tax=Mariniflexile fucanivorans TaxID=264023 RepID=A0A4R1RKF0_9FLAO|nr:glycoside hydrolase family 88 protein [Mariniflexile fucanivorans]TCL66182.1 unsaturated chondroitin disaccharide hydrolase [Mariniflexile fucanivorans]